MDQDIDVLMVAPQPFFETRGVPISVYLRCEAMAQRGGEIDLVTYPMGDEKVPRDTSIFRIPNPFFFDQVPAGPSIRKFLLDLVLFGYLFVFLLDRDKEYDCLQAHEEGALLCGPLAWLFDLPLVYDHHSDLEEITRDSPYSAFSGVMSLIERIALGFSDLVVCVIPTLYDSLKKRVDHDRVFLIPDTAPEELMDPSEETSVPEEVSGWLDPDRTTLVYTGSLAGYQTMNLFLEGLAGASNRESLQFLLVGGTPSELQELREVLEDLNLENTVKLTGRVPGEVVPACLDVADVLVCPRAECRNTPLKIYTYLWAGKPILVSDVESHRVIFEGNEALWAEPTVGGYRKTLESLSNCDLNEFRDRIRGKYEKEYSYACFEERHEPLVESIRSLKTDRGDQS